MTDNDMQDILSGIPSGVQLIIRRHLVVIRSFNEEIERLRRMSEGFLSAGRYESEYRQAHQEKAEQSVTALRDIEQLPSARKRNMRLVYDALGFPQGRELAPISEQAKVWDRQ